MGEYDAPGGPVKRFRSVGHAIERGVFLALLLVIWPVMAVVAALIWLAGQSPIFRQKRVGFAARDFEILKFRTIPDEGWDRAAARASASRVARLRLGLFGNISALLRATGLDELPQFINIVRGDMRLIGPRPLTRSDFMALPEAREARCAVPPGITGLAQVNGGQELDARSKLALDLYFIDHASPAMTAEIVFRSICRITGLTMAVERTCHCALARAMHHMAARSHQPDTRHRNDQDSRAA